MPINKNALERFRVIDRLLSDPNKDYTTLDILRRVNSECSMDVSLRMIQKDIRAIEEEFGKKVVRKRGAVKYEDQSSPIFYKELTSDEREVLCESLKTLGQFEGLENFTSLELLRKRLNLDDAAGAKLISFSRNDVLKIPSTLLARLFTAISRKKVIRFTYTRFGCKSETAIVYPYQLRQYNDRWFLLATPFDGKDEPYSGKIVNYALDRMAETFDYIDEIPYIPTSVDIDRRFDEIVGVTLLEDKEVEQIYFGVKPESANYVRTKSIHQTQIELKDEDAVNCRKGHPALSDCAIFSIECRPNYELKAQFASFGANLIVFEPASLANEMKKMMTEAAKNYSDLNLD